MKSQCQFRLSKNYIQNIHLDFYNTCLTFYDFTQVIVYKLIIVRKSYKLQQNSLRRLKLFFYQTRKITSVYIQFPITSFLLI